MSNENINLEEMVEQTLETTGVLSKMRAELRANVFLVLEKGSSIQKKTYSDKLVDFLSNKNGLLLLSLVNELLEYLELTFTTSVLGPETGAGHEYKYKNRDDIYNELSLSKDDERPLLLQILEDFQSYSKSANEVKNYSIQHNSKTYDRSSLGQILKNNIEQAKDVLDNKTKIVSPIINEVLEESKQVFDNQTNSESLSSSNHNSSDNIQLKEVDSSESLNSSNFEQLLPIKIPSSVEQNDNTEDDIKSDIKSNNESSLEDIETDENVSFGNDSLPSTDSFNQNSSPEILKTRNINL